MNLLHQMLFHSQYTLTYLYHYILLYYSHQKNHLFHLKFMEFMVMYGDHRQSKYLQFWLHNCFVQPLNGHCQISSPFYIQKVLWHAGKQYAVAKG